MIFLFLSNLAWSTDEEQSSIRQVEHTRYASTPEVSPRGTEVLLMGVIQFNEEIRRLHKENQALKQCCDAEVAILHMENQAIGQSYDEEATRLHMENQEIRQSYDEKIMRLHKKNQELKQSYDEKIERFYKENQKNRLACITCPEREDHILLERLLVEKQREKVMLAKKIANLRSTQADQKDGSRSNSELEKLDT